MEKNCREHIKIEPVGNTIVYHRCLEDMADETCFCKKHLDNHSSRDTIEQ